MSRKGVRDAFRTKLPEVMPAGFTFKDSINTARRDDAATIYITAEYLLPASIRLSIGNPGNDWWKDIGTVQVICRVERGDGIGGVHDPEAALAIVGAALLGRRFDGVLVTEVDGVDTTGSDDSHFRAVLAVHYWFKYRG